jgi:hypothetical protein
VWTVRQKEYTHSQTRQTGQTDRETDRNNDKDVRTYVRVCVCMTGGWMDIQTAEQTDTRNARSEVFTAVTMKDAVF